MKCAIMQPTFIPWLGFFDLIRTSDKFVIYDHVQFEKQSWQQRNRIRDKQGILLLTVPVAHHGGLNREIKDVKIDYSRNFFPKHLNSIKHSYSKSQNFSVIYSELESIFQKNHTFLMDFNLELIYLGMKFLSIEKEFIFSSELNIKNRKVEALIEVCKLFNIDHYISPLGAKNYIDENNIFPENNIHIEYQNFSHPVYKQINFKDFIGYLSYIDYLFNIDLDEAKLFGSFKTTY